MRPPTIVGERPHGREQSATQRRFRYGTSGFPLWARHAPHRLVWSSPTSGTWQLHAGDLTGGESWQVTDVPGGVTEGAIDPSGRWIWWFDGCGGSERGVWFRRPFPRGPAQDARLPAAYSGGLILTADHAVVASSASDGTTIHLVRLDGGRTTVVHHSPSVLHLGAGAADGSLMTISRPDAGHDGEPHVAVLDLTGRQVAGSSDAGAGLVPGSWSPVDGDQRLIVQVYGEVVRPAIWSPLDGALRALDLDLDGSLDCRWSPDASALLVIRERAGRSTLHLHDLRTGRTENVPTEPGTVHDVAVRPDGHIWYLWSSGAQPYRLAGATAPALQPPGSAPAGLPYRDLQVGDVPGFVVEPDGPRPHATVFVLHGGPARHDQDAYCPRVQSWVAAGFAVVMVNYHGSSGYGRRWQDSLRHPSGPGLTELADLLAVREHLVGTGIADPGRIVLEGGSWGGYLVLLALGLQPELWRAGVAVVPVADWQATYEDEPESTRAHDRALFGGTPAELPEYYAERSPLTYADRLRAPVMIVTGRNDPHCPRRQISRYVDRLRRHRKRFVVREFDGGHGSLDVAELVTQQQQQIAFAREALSETAWA